MTLRPRNYSRRDFYDNVIYLTRYSFSWEAILRRFRATQGLTSLLMNLVRAGSTDGFAKPDAQEVYANAAVKPKSTAAA